ncbi:type 4a pilus biogenesis protein PilO [Geobacter sp. DSM 9736]|uniref:type 4a pilus biogenesis protein PilO n=1 Tax=Geobacter sp. DSM 9736 TaxID=1277350 RepID=UPI000B502EE8|nr:type 4a pilus biogenesis protein PilO [Geobacter sp. DSM 9736]SNB45280.1 type 4 prepilin peptidase 1 Aspartic peptidase. MEROPS family A24A [Geobacter sp. DSM 9736]
MNIEFIRQVVQTRQMTFGALALLLIANLGLYLFTTIYQAPRLSALQAQAAEKRQLASAGITQDAATIFRQGKADLATWESRIAPKKEFARFVGELFEVAAGNSLKVGGVTYKVAPIKEEKNLLAFSIGFNVAGKYAGIKSFISDLSRMRDIMYIENLALNNPRATEEVVDLKLQLTAIFRMEGT